MHTPSRIAEQVLLIDSDPIHARALEVAITSAGDRPMHLEWAPDLSSGLETLAQRKAWAVFLNLSLPDSQGLETFDRTWLKADAAPVVVLGGVDDDGLCQAAMVRGARDYLLEGHLDSYAFARALRNITEREVARQELFIEHERAQVTLNSIGDAVLSVDVAGNVTYLNVVAEQMTGWSTKEAVGLPLADVFHIVDSVTRLASRNPLELAIQLDRAVGLNAHCILIRRDGHEAAIEDSAAPIHDRDGRITGAVIVFRDVKMARSMVLEMEHLAQHDALTGLPNRALLKERLAQAILLARRNHSHLAVLFLDVDGFKHINDTLGHHLGDRLLQSIATRLSACVRKSDTVSRQGGDEFVILLPEVTATATATIGAARIIAGMKRPHLVADHSLRVTASIGISTYPDCGDDADTLIKNADTAMYQAKEQGRDTYRCFDHDMNLRAVERQALERQLRDAVDDGELLVHYQPKVNLATGAITSVEALVRWQHPDRGLLLPGQFLAIAEEGGIMEAIGHWVLHEACRQTQEWIDAGLPAVPVAVNVSAMEFQGAQFFEGVQTVLRSTRLNPSFLELELTETVLMRHAEAGADALDRLKAIGVRLAIDDFGTGYSSLSYLTRFRFDSLKLDQSFVRDIAASSENAIVVSTIISMAKSLRHRVIAEGVETSEQLAFLQSHGCDEGQGYYFSRPVIAQQFARLLETGVAASVVN